MGKKIIVKKPNKVNANIKVTQATREKKTSKEHEEVYSAPDVSTETKVAKVGIHLGTTINLGDFNSVKMEVFLELPCKVDEIDEQFLFAREWVEERVSELADEARE